MIVLMMIVAMLKDLFITVSAFCIQHTALMQKQLNKQTKPPSPSTKSHRKIENIYFIS